jgi:PASTA domain
LAEHSTSQNSLLQKLLTTLVVASAFIASAFVVMYLSFRSSEVTVPAVIGKSEADAEKLLVAQGLRLKVRNRATDEKIDANLISEQIPSGNSSAKSGQFVSVTVSTGIQAREKKDEEIKAVAKPSASPKPKPSASPSPKDKAKDNKDKEKNKDGKDAKADVQSILSDKNKSDKNKVADKTDKVKTGDDKSKAKPTVTPSAKPSPKASPKPAVKEN